MASTSIIKGKIVEYIKMILAHHTNLWKPFWDEYSLKLRFGIFEIHWAQNYSLAAGTIGNVKAFYEAMNALGWLFWIFGMSNYIYTADFSLVMYTDAKSKMKLSSAIFGCDVFGKHGFLKLDIRQYCVGP